MERNIIGRDYEKQRLSELYKSKQPEFVAVYGRRRVGKTFIVREMFQNKITFDLVGLAKSTMSEQLTNFNITLNQATKIENPKAKNWLEAFAQLRNFLEKSEVKRKVVFIDEIPWFDTKRSGFCRHWSTFGTLGVAFKKS